SRAWLVPAPPERKARHERFPDRCRCTKGSSARSASCGLASARFGRDARGSLGGVRELMFQTDIARRIYSRVAGSQEIVDADADVSVIPHACGLEIQVLDVWRPADACQDFVDGNAEFIVVASEINDFPGALHANSDRRCVEMNLDAVARQGIRQNLRSVTFFIGQERRIALRDDYMCAEAAKGLRQFTAEGATAHHQQTRRAFG